MDTVSEYGWKGDCWYSHSVVLMRGGLGLGVKGAVGDLIWWIMGGILGYHGWSCQASK